MIPDWLKMNRTRSLSIAGWSIIGIVLGGAALITIIVRNWDLKEGRPVLISAAVLFASVAIVWWSYYNSRQVEKTKFAVDKRNQFIFNSICRDVRSRIEHNDIRLQTIVAATNVPNPYDYDLIPETEWDLHENFDAYLNWIEGYALLWKKGLIEDTEMQGLWSYYLKRLRDVNTNEAMIGRHLRDKWGYDTGQINEFMKSRAPTKDFEYPNDSIEGKGVVKTISPIQNPIWFYVRRPNYEYAAIIELVEYCIKKNL